MFVVCVHVTVKPGKERDFINASRENASNTVMEPGALRFDVLQQQDDPACFVLYEVYRDQAAAAAHKETEHYQRWRETVADWMAAERRGVKYTGLFPESDAMWAAVG